MKLLAATFVSCSPTVLAESATAPPASAEPEKLSLPEIRREVLEYCENIRDKEGPYGCYRMGVGRRSDLYASCDVAEIRTIMGEDLTKTLTPEQRKEWINHINSYQMRTTGEYEDSLGHSRLHANGMVIGALGALDGQQRYPVTLYEPFDTPEEVADWLETTVDWENQWGSSHLFWGGLHCFSMSKACTPEWREAVFDWLDANLDPQTGWWRKGTEYSDRHQALGGFVHIVPIYEHHGRKFPLPEKVIDSVLAMQLPDGCWLESKHSNGLTYLELDALYALAYMRKLAPDYRTADIDQAIRKYAASAAKNYAKHKAGLYQRHPHLVLAFVGCVGLLQQHLPDEYPDDVKWTDIFSDRRFYRTDQVERLDPKK